MRSLRFYLNGDTNVVHALYELLCNNCSDIVVRQPGKTPGQTKTLSLKAKNLRPVGFAADEYVLPYSHRSFVGYRLLQEYFAFPEKFFFFDLEGLEALGEAGFKDQAEVIFLISRFERTERQQTLEMGISNRTFRLGCAPVINLFPQTAEPIQVSQTRFEYPIVPDVRRQHAMEIFFIDDVVATNPATREIVKVEPFYAFRHNTVKEKRQCFWHATRRQVPGEERTEMVLSLVDLAGMFAAPDSDALTVRCSCTNFDRPSRLPFGSEDGDFVVEGLAAVRKAICLRKPTATVRPPVGKNSMWRLVSHLSLNYLSLVEEGKNALQEILRLYNYTDSAFLQNQIAGINRVESRKHFALVPTEYGVAPARGTRVHMELDEEQFVGGGAYLFASVLECFLGLYVSLNSFSQLVATSLQRKEVLREWPPRAGSQMLI